MKIHEARKILGLSPKEDPRPRLAQLAITRERLAKRLRTAPSQAEGDRNHRKLLRFDQALAVISKPSALSESPTPIQTPTPPIAHQQRSSPRSHWALTHFIWLIIFLTVAAASGFFHFKSKDDQESLRQQRLASLERKGIKFIESRSWQEAATIFSEIETLIPGSELTKFGRNIIEAGIAEEQNQFIGYWTGQAIAELEAGRLNEAEASARRVLEKFPADLESTKILKRIAESRTSQSRINAIGAARKQLDDGRFDAAIDAARKLLITHPNDSDVNAIIDDASARLTKQIANRATAINLLNQAIARDHGQFDQQALDWLREAASLDPGNMDIAKRLEAMSSYTRTLRVPGDFATPADALASARERDRILLTEAIWKGPLTINVAVDLQGAGFDKTIVECPAGDGSAITIGPEAKGARITGITFRHESFLAVGADRFSAALVRGGTATFTDCHFENASGHGLAVIETGQATANRCRFFGNGWNGAAAIGKDCKLEVRESEAIENFEHGIETWDGAASNLVNNRCHGNSRNGIHADNHATEANIQGNQLNDNREFGIVLDSAGSGKISGNTIRHNLLGGMVIRAAAATVKVTGNQLSLNQGPGLILEKGLTIASYSENTVSENTAPDLLTGATLSHEDDQAPDSSNP